jgi:aconitate hydratase
MLIPEVIGFKLDGALPEGATATDLVLTVTQMLRKKGVVGKFVEFYGDGLITLTLEDQATIANMAPEYGATCGFFPVSRATIDYLAATNRTPERVALVEAYAKEQGMWFEPGQAEPVFSSTLELDLGEVQPSLAGPKRPQDRVLLNEAAAKFAESLVNEFGKSDATARTPVQGEKFDVKALQDLPAFRSAIRAAIDRVNQDLSVIEKVRQFAFADEAFSIENEEMTPSLKIRRHKLKERYSERLDALYKG